MLVVFRGAEVIRPYVAVEFILLPRSLPNGTDADSQHVFGCPTMGASFMAKSIKEYIPSCSAINASEWFVLVPSEYRTIVMDAAKAAFEEIGFLKVSIQDLCFYVQEWHRQIWLTVAREGLAE